MVGLIVTDESCTVGVPPEFAFGEHGWRAAENPFSIP